MCMHEASEINLNDAPVESYSASTIATTWTKNSFSTRYRTACCHRVHPSEQPSSGQLQPYHHALNPVVLEQLTVLNYRISIINFHKQLWDMYLKSGTGQIEIIDPALAERW